MKMRRGNTGPGAVRWSPGTLPGPVAEGTGRTAVRLELTGQGRDLVLRITGGTAHVGAVAVCDGRRLPDHAGLPDQLVVLPGHKEGPLAAEAAEVLARAAGCACVAVVGIHQDDATPEEILAIVANVRTGLERLAAAVRPAGSGPA